MSAWLSKPLGVAGRFRHVIVAVLIAGTPSVAVHAKGDLQPRSSCADHIDEAARLSGLPSAWVEQVMLAESAGYVGAVSKAGAIGCMQLMPATWRELTARHALGSDPFDPRPNMIGGAIYLRAMNDRFGWPGALAAYNAGPTRYAERLANARPMPAETQAYVARIAGAGGPRLHAQAKAQAVLQAVDWRSSTVFAKIGRSPDESVERFEQGPSTATATVDQHHADVSLAAPKQVASALFVPSKP